MPETAESDLDVIKSIVSKSIENFGGIINGEFSEEPLAFGLKFLKVTFAYDEEKGSTDDVEEELMKNDNIQSVEVLNVGRAMG